MPRRFGIFARTLGRFVPSALVRPFGRPVVLFFHGVEQHTDDPRVQTNHHEVDDFVQILKAIKASFDVLPLAAVSDALAHPERHRRSVFLTSDDGYANTLTIAADLLEDMGLPWTLFISTHHVDTGERNPMFLIRLFFHYAPEGQYDIPFLGPVVLGDEDVRERQVARAVERLRLMNFKDASRALAAMLAAFPDDTLRRLLKRFSSEAFLSWGQITDLKRRGVEIGAHAHHHWAMHAGQDPLFYRDEARRSRERIEKEVGACRYFAYPHGNVDDVSRRAWEAVRDAGYDYAFTTLSGTLDASLNPFLLPRFCLGPHQRGLTSVVPLLRAANPRLAEWQKRMAG
ncbi:MAG: polysaccharide deacetylase family protein [Alphaproteobacteria bacterium]|nr:polysaccharide deacetylase family protein [Alphaproteobacteria bacterium]